MSRAMQSAIDRGCHAIRHGARHTPRHARMARPMADREATSIRGA